MAPTWWRARAGAAQRTALLFVHDHHVGWSNRKNDDGRGAYDNFNDNVIVQIKNGPIDFQVREPRTPKSICCQGRKAER